MNSETPCAVCHAPSSGFHFGVEVCSACSAFFRRTVSKNITFLCWKEPPNDCEIEKRGLNGAAICKSCRFAKCLAVGMKTETVQKTRDFHGKREARAPETSLVPSPSSFVVNRSVFSIMDTILQTYSQLEHFRLYTHHNDKNLFTVRQRVPRHVNYKETIAIYLKEFYLIGDWVAYCFPEFAEFPEDQRNILLRNFNAQFTVLEQGYQACKHGRTDIRYLPSGDYIDCVHPETYYFDPDGQQTMTPQEAVKMFASSFQNYRRNIIMPLVREKTDRFEFLALVGMALFDADLDSISEETSRRCRECRGKIQKEMMKYYMSTRNSEEEASLRLANFVSIIPSLHRATRRFLEDIEMSYVMNAYSVDQTYYDNCLPKFGDL